MLTRAKYQFEARALPRPEELFAGVEVPLLASVRLLLLLLLLLKVLLQVLLLRGRLLLCLLVLPPRLLRWICIILRLQLPLVRVRIRPRLPLLLRRVRAVLVLLVVGRRCRIIMLRIGCVLLLRVLLLRVQCARIGCVVTLVWIRRHLVAVLLVLLLLARQLALLHAGVRRLGKRGATGGELRGVLLAAVLLLRAALLGALELLEEAAVVGKRQRHAAAPSRSLVGARYKNAQLEVLLGKDSRVGAWHTACRREQFNRNAACFGVSRYPAEYGQVSFCELEVEATCISEQGACKDTAEK